MVPAEFPFLLENQDLQGLSKWLVQTSSAAVSWTSNVRRIPIPSAHAFRTRRAQNSPDDI